MVIQHKWYQTMPLYSRVTNFKRTTKIMEFLPKFIAPGLATNNLAERNVQSLKNKLLDTTNKNIPTQEKLRQFFL